MMVCSKKMRQDETRTISQQLHNSESNFDGTPSNFDLIPFFPNEVTMGPFMACIPWYMKPLMMTLNKTWANALKNPLYAIPQYQPKALKNSVIFYTHTPVPSGNSLVLNLYQDGVFRRLPLPHDIPTKSYGFVRFFVTQQCIYALTLAAADPDIYNVYMLHLGGGMIKWQSLPTLPNLGQCIYISTIISKDGDSMHDYIWMRDNDICIGGVTEEKIYLSTGHITSVDDADDWSAWLLHTTTREGKRLRVPSPPPSPAPPLKKCVCHPPEYLDIYDMDSSRPRHLYKLFRVYEYSLQLDHRNIFEPAVEPGCLMVFNDDYDGVIKGINCIRKQVDTDGNIELQFYKRDLKYTEALEGEEIDEFYMSWKNFLPNWRYFLPEQIKALSFNADLSERMDGWEWKFSLPSSESDDLVLNEQSTIKVAQQGPVYIYAYIATKCTDMYLQGEDQIPVSFNIVKENPV